MKITTLLLIITVLTFKLINAQDYEIVSIEPIKLISGTDNNIKIVFNQKLAQEDTLEWAEIWALDDEGYIEADYLVVGDFFNNDSVYFASCFIPKGRVHDNCELVFVTFDWDSGSFVGFDTARYSGIIIDGGIAGVDPEICMVSTDSSGRNMVIWEPDYEKFVDSVAIYKETAVNDEFEMVGKKSIEEISIFVDEESENARSSNRYKIAYTDTIGDISNLSPPHKTLHLLMSAGINGSINLIWTKYEGFEYTTFHVYRGSSKQEMMKITELASNIFTYSDLVPPLDNLYYQVVIEHPSPCDITMEKSTQTLFSSTKSNIVEHIITSGKDVGYSEYQLYVYPNPVSNELTVRIDELNSEYFDVTIHDLSGRKVKSYTSVSNDSKLDISNLKAGMYMISIKAGGINENKLIIKE